MESTEDVFPFQEHIGTGTVLSQLERPEIGLIDSNRDMVENYLNYSMTSDNAEFAAPPLQQQLESVHLENTNFGLNSDLLAEFASLRRFHSISVRSLEFNIDKLKVKPDLSHIKRFSVWTQLDDNRLTVSRTDNFEALRTPQEHSERTPNGEKVASGKLRGSSVCRWGATSTT
ncbi:hypothetical protein quinque_015309 [Culex quinquefasciatus]